ncbi:MAG: ABC transporter permease subunit [Eubacteriales bacterium]|nr:ABC transporter permease subunit [Eubacteriales bacterium]
MTKSKRQEFVREVKKSKTLLLMILPAVLIIFVFAYLPMGGMILAFKQFNYRDGILGSPWTEGIFDNFKFFFMSGKAFGVTLNTFLYNLSFIAVNTVLAVSFAVVLSEATGKRFKKLTQSAIFLPYFVSWVIVGTIAYNLLNYENGVVNGVLMQLGMEPVNVYADGPIWRVLIVLFNAWKGVGYSMVVYLAAVTGIDMQLHEAAKIDGANIFQRVRHVTFPAVVPTIVTMVLLDVSKIFRGNLDLFYQLIGKNGALYEATDVIDTFVFRSLLETSDIGMAAAAGFYQSVLCFVTIMVVNGIVKKAQSEYALF